VRSHLHERTPARLGGARPGRGTMMYDFFIGPHPQPVNAEPKKLFIFFEHFFVLYQRDIRGLIF